MEYGEPHILVITKIPAYDEWEEETEYHIEHPEGCPSEEHRFTPDAKIVYIDYTCGVGYEVTNVGLEGLRDLDDLPGYVKPEGASRWGFDDWKGLPEGRYVIRSWHTYYEYCGEYDGGLELLGREGEVVAT